MKNLKKVPKMAVFGTPNNTLVLGPFLVGPKTDLNWITNVKKFIVVAKKLCNDYKR
jgi:hypothetical protein